MMTSTSSVPFPGFLGKPVSVSFDAPQVTSNAGWLLLGNLDRQIGLTRRLAAALVDPRQPALVHHSLLDQLRQRIYQIAAGYEDCNDADRLRSDPLLKVVLGRLPSQEDLASQPTLCRFENARTTRELYALAWELVEYFIDSRKGRPTYRLILDLDGTPDETHGQQHFAFFNGHVRHHCFQPLFGTLTCNHETEQFPLLALLRAGNCANYAGALPVLKRLVRRLREAFPGVQILIRLDGGFAHPPLYEWLEAEGLPYVINLPKNAALERLAAPLLQEAQRVQKKQGGTVRQFGQVAYQAKSWSRQRRVVVKAEVTPKGPNPRFLVTSRRRGEPKKHYDFYTGRGDVENRIKEWKLDLKADRTSCHAFLANQFRLLLHLFAYVLWVEMRRRLAGTGLGRAQVGQMRLRLMGVGAWVAEQVRGVRVRIAHSYPYRGYWQRLTLAWEPMPDG